LTEADPAAVLGSLLVMCSTYIGPATATTVSGREFPSRLFAVIVGETSLRRKGTAVGDATGVMDTVVGDFSARFMEGGLGSGEALVEMLASREERRVLLTEEEFAAVLTVASREGSTLSAQVRKAWDGTTLRNRTKSDVLEAAGSHLCVLGQVTPTELVAQLASVEVANGFANRFLFIASHSPRTIVWEDEELTGPDFLRALVEPHARLLRSRLEAGAGRGLVRMDKAALDHLFELRTAPRSASSRTVEHLSARREPMVLRLALLYAVLDGAEQVGVEHLIAAEAVVAYSSATAEHLFGGRTGNAIADQVLRYVVEAGPEGITLTELQRLFQNHLKAAARDEALEVLTRLELVTVEELKTGGRPVKVLRATEAKKATEGRLALAG